MHVATNRERVMVEQSVSGRCSCVTVDRPSAISKISQDSAVPILARPHRRQEGQLRQAWIGWSPPSGDDGDSRRRTKAPIGTCWGPQSARRAWEHLPRENNIIDVLLLLLTIDFIFLPVVCLLHPRSRGHSLATYASTLGMYVVCHCLYSIPPYLAASRLLCLA